MGKHKDDNPANRDPVTGAPGSHPVGTATGAASGGLAGAAIGTVAGGQITFQSTNIEPFVRRARCA